MVDVLTDSENPRRYWSDLKRKLKAEGADELYEKIVQLKLRAPDGKRCLTDIADTQLIHRSTAFGAAVSAKLLGRGPSVRGGLMRRAPCGIISAGNRNLRGERQDGQFGRNQGDLDTERLSGERLYRRGRFEVLPGGPGNL